MESNVINIVFSKIEFLIPIIVLLGYIAASVQKITRLAYYKVDIVYLFGLHISEVFLGVCYLLLLCLPIYEAVLYNCGNSWSGGINIVCAVILMLGQVYSLKLKVNKNFVIAMVIYVVYLMTAHIFVCVYFDWIKEFVNSLVLSDIVLYFLTIFLCFILLVVALQFWAEHTNERFTYIKTTNGDTYTIITIFQGCFMTVRSKFVALSTNGETAIELYRGDIVLFPIDNYEIQVKFVDAKILL